MSWPRNTDYNEAIQNLRSSVSDEELREGQPVLNPLGVPSPYSGNFADVYKVHCPKTGNTWAVKCFTREVAGLGDRYREISSHLNRKKLGFMVDFEYLEPGIRAAGGWHPFLKMRWVEGLNLNQFVGDYLDRPKMLKQLLGLWVKLSARLREAEVAHADLQHGNVLLVPASNQGHLGLKLIDYDGMYVPAFLGKRSGESGHSAYQHPRRSRDKVFSVEVDRFPHLAIYTAIHCLTLERRALWQEFNNDDNLLFRETDFHEPGGSKVFRTLWSLKDANARALVGWLVLACRMPVDQAPLLEQVVDNGRVRPLSRDESRQANAIMDGAIRAAPPTAPGTHLPAASPSPPSLAEAANEEADGDADGETPSWTTDRQDSEYGSSKPATPSISSALLGAFAVRWRSARQRLFGTRESQARVLSFAITAVLVCVLAIVFVVANRGTRRTQDPPTDRDVAAKHVEPKKEKTELEASSAKGDTGPEVTSKKNVAASQAAVSHTWPVESLGRENISPEEMEIVSSDGLASDTVVAVFGDARMKHWSGIRCLAFSPDGRTLATAGEDAVARLWDAASGRLVHAFSPQAREVAFSPDGRNVVTSAQEVIAWDRSTMEIRWKQAHGSDSLAFSPDGNLVAVRGPLLLDSRTGEKIRQLDPQTNGVWQVTFTPDSKRLAAACHGDKIVRVWDVLSGKLLHELPHGDHVNAVVVSPDGRTIASAGNTWSTAPGMIKLWDGNTAALRKSLGHHPAGVVSVAFNKDGSSLLTSGMLGEFNLWDANTPTNPEVFWKHGQRTRLAFTPDGQTLATADVAVRMWNWSDRSKPSPPERHTGIVRCVACTADGRVLASAGGDGTVKLWDLATGKVTANFEGHRGAVWGMVLSPDGKTLISAGNETIQLWDCQKKERKSSQPNGCGNPSFFGISPPALAISRDGTTFASSNGGGDIRLWKADGSEHQAIGGAADKVNALVFGREGKTLATGALDGMIKLWDVMSRTELKQMKAPEAVTAVALSDDGKTIVSGDRKGAVRFWDVAKAAEIAVVNEHKEWVWSLSYSPDGKTIASSASDGTVRLWNADTREVLAAFTLARAKADIHQVIFTPDGRHLATANANGTIFILRLPESLIPKAATLNAPMPKEPPASSPKPELAVAPFDANQAKTHQEQWAKYLNVATEETNSIGMKLVLIPPGEFLMGSPPSQVGRGPDEVLHRVRLTRPFYMSIFEVTQKQYEAVMNQNRSGFKGADRPVEGLNWNQAKAFCDALTRREGRRYRLATEAEWEFACRAGTTTAFAVGDPSATRTLVTRAFLNETANAGAGKPNSFGLYDMHANVWEWCADWYGAFSAGEQTDPTGPDSGNDRVVRGGWHGDGENQVGSAERAMFVPGIALDDIGFRVILDATGSVGAGSSKEIPVRGDTPDSQSQAPLVSPAGKPIDVLRLIDVRKHGYLDEQLARDATGPWVREGNAVLSPGGLNDRGLLRLPVVVPGEYTLEIVAQRVVGGDALQMVLYAAGRQFTLTVECTGGRLSGLDLIDGVGFVTNGTLYDKPCTVAGKPNTVLATVHKGGVRMEVNGKTIVDWKGDHSRLSRNSQRPIPDKESVYIGSYGTTWRITRLTLTPLKSSDAAQVNVPSEETNSIGMKLVLIPAGEFMMGSSDSEGGSDEHPQHRVRITKPFWLGIHEVTVGQFRQFAEDTKHPNTAWRTAFSGRRTDEHPVVSVSWNDADAFLKWLSAKEGKSYRLPTEAEWEYACRAGTTTKYSFGDDENNLGDYAWYKGNLRGTMHPVGGKKPNAWGLYDMHGNAREWCQDWYAPYPLAQPMVDPSGPVTGQERVVRGGCWSSGGLVCRAAYRFRILPAIRIDFLGFRVAAVRDIELKPRQGRQPK